MLQNLLAQLRDAARAERQDDIAGFGAARNRFHSGLRRWRVFHAAMSELPDALGESLGIYAFDGALGGGVDVE